MIIKSTYKSHFFLKKNFLKKNKKKQIFSKNMVIFILFSKIFLKNINLSILFTNKKTNKLNILKAPSRHKKFFHQIFMEYFCIKIKWFILTNHKIDLLTCVNIFLKINNIFLKIGSNTLTRTKFKLIYPNIKLLYLFCI